MPSNARIFCRMMDWADPNGSEGDGYERYRLEWASLEGTNPRLKGKEIVTLFTTTKTRLATDLIDTLVTRLNDQYPNADYRDRDIVLWGA